MFASYFLRLRIDWCWSIDKAPLPADHFREVGRVTGLREFLPNGRLFNLGSFLVTEVPHIFVLYFFPKCRLCTY
jgi:hypothetical protein